MRPILFLLTLSVLCCKSSATDQSAETNMHPSARALWTAFVQAHPEHKESPIPEAWFFHNNEADANRLAQLTLEGKKKASSGLYVWYKEAGAPLPQVGTKNIVTDFKGNAKVIIETTKVDTVPFDQVSKRYAKWDMGTTIAPLEKWRKAHWDFFSQALEESGKTPAKDVLVVCEEFQKIWPQSSPD